MLAQHAAQGQTDAIRALLASGEVDVNASNPFGQTPVMLAVRGGHLDAAVQLALSGADLSLRDTEGRTALQLAIESSSREASLALLLIATAKFTKPLSYPATQPPKTTIIRHPATIPSLTGSRGQARTPSGCAGVGERRPAPGGRGRGRWRAQTAAAPFSGAAPVSACKSPPASPASPASGGARDTQRDDAARSPCSNTSPGRGAAAVAAPLRAVGRRGAEGHGARKAVHQR